jgi:hypothetical protein
MCQGYHVGLGAGRKKKSTPCDGDRLRALDRVYGGYPSRGLLVGLETP